MKRNKKPIMLILLVLTCLALAVTGTLAAYNKSSYLKRVVSTMPGTNDERFSSNYLSPVELGSTSFEARQIRLSEGADMSLGVTVCNYLQSDITKYSSGNIKFKLSAALLDANGNSVADNPITINGTPMASFDFSQTYTLPGGQPNMELFTFACDKGSISSLKGCHLRVQAIPTESAVSKTLAADFYFSASQATSLEWTGAFSIDNAGLSTGLDAFNYDIHGSKECDVSLKYDTTKIKISQFSLEELGTTDDGSGVITFHVGGEGQPTSYRLQFYRVNGIPEGENWTTVNGYIIFPYSE